MLQIENYQQISFLEFGRDVYLKNQIYGFKWEGTYRTETMLAFHFPIFREEMELLETKSNQTKPDQTKQKPQKALVGRKAGN